MRSVAISLCPTTASSGYGGEHLQQRVERDILRVGEGFEVRAFELDAEREIVAALPAPELRGSGMPGAIEARHELDTAPATIDIEVCRDARTGHAGKESVGADVELVQE